MRAILLCTLLLAGCATKPIVHDQTFPTPPVDLMQPAPKLQPITGLKDGSADPKTALSTIVDNNTTSQQIAAQLTKLQLWIIWTKANIDSQGKIAPPK